MKTKKSLLIMCYFATTLTVVLALFYAIWSMFFVRTSASNLGSHVTVFLKVTSILPYITLLVLILLSLLLAFFKKTSYDLGIFRDFIVLGFNLLLIKPVKYLVKYYVFSSMHINDLNLLIFEDISTGYELILFGAVIATHLVFWGHKLSSLRMKVGGCVILVFTLLIIILPPVVNLIPINVTNMNFSLDLSKFILIFVTWITLLISYNSYERVS